MRQIERPRLARHSGAATLIIVCATLGCGDPKAAKSVQPPTAASNKITTPIEAQPSISSAPFVLAPRRQDFGAVGDLEKRVVVFTIENTSASPVRLGQPKVSCDCMRVTLAPGAIQPGETRRGEINVTLGRGIGRFDKYVDFFLPDGSHSQRLRVVAQRHPGLTLDPRFGAVKPITFLGGTLPESRQIVRLTRNAPDGLPLVVEQLRAEEMKGAIFKTQLRPLTEFESRIIIDAKSGGAEGNISARIRATVNGLPLEIPVHGFQYEHLVRRPQQFSFLRIDDPVSAKTEVQIYSPNKVPFEITEAVFVEGRRKSAAQIDVTTESRPGGGYTLVARPRAPYPDKTGSLSGVVRVRTTHPDLPENLFELVDCCLALLVAFLCC